MTGALGTVDAMQKNAELPSNVALKNAQAAHAMAVAKQLTGNQPVTINTPQGAIQVDPAHALDFMSRMASTDVQRSELGLQDRRIKLLEEANVDEREGRKAVSDMKRMQADALKSFTPTGDPAKDLPQLVRIDPSAATSYIRQHVEEIARKSRSAADTWVQVYGQTLSDLSKDTAWSMVDPGDRETIAWQRADRAVANAYDPATGKPRQMPLSATGTAPAAPGTTQGATQAAPPPGSTRVSAGIYKAPDGTIWKSVGPGRYMKQ